MWFNYNFQYSQIACGRLDTDRQTTGHWPNWFRGMENYKKKKPALNV